MTAQAEYQHLLWKGFPNNLTARPILNSEQQCRRLCGHCSLPATSASMKSSDTHTYTHNSVLTHVKASWSCMSIDVICVSLAN